MARDSTWRARAATLWVALQVELQGQYSLERLRRVARYTQRVSWWRALPLAVLTPLPSVAATALLDCIRVEPVAAGAAQSPRLWLRCFLTCLLISFFVLEQLRRLAPQMLLSRRFLVAATLVSAGATVVALAALARLVAYPLPATTVLAIAIWALVLLAGLLLRWRLATRRDRRWRQRHASGGARGRLPPPSGDFATVVGHPALILFSQTAPTVAYTLYGYAYASSSARLRPALIYVLPALKIAVKNAISWSLRDVDDLKPETVSFTVEIFHALFVSSSMRLTASRWTMLAIVAVGLAQTLLLLNDVRLLVARLRDVGRKIEEPARAASSRSGGGSASPSGSEPKPTGGVTLAALLQVAGHLARIDRSVRSNHSMRASTWEAHEPSARGTFRVAPLPSARSDATATASGSGGALVKAPSTEHLTEALRDARPVVRPVSRSSSPRHASRGSGGRERQASSIAGSLSFGGSRSNLEGLRSVATQRLVARTLSVLNDKERAHLVRKTLQTLYVTEYIALVKYTEAIMPLIFASCLTLLFYMANRASFHFLEGIQSGDELLDTVRYLVMYAVLELAVFVLISLGLWRALGISLPHQLAFVLDSQPVMVQAKFIVWVVFVVHASLVQLGANTFLSPFRVAT
ncbi:hypothetical protein P43SY_007432 [Pythium insidiosum]|uniref:Transmembrane protein n=1 Tax=Pythium insidiosum TaxID=114742 RepID=A0AAD5Q4L2_PYTIN|nr:hypothetical protein P43SY_007432 [Pythium insidiosum]